MLKDEGVLCPAIVSWMIYWGNTWGIISGINLIYLGISKGSNCW
jgi:hypothetical protein